MPRTIVGANRWDLWSLGKVGRQDDRPSQEDGICSRKESRGELTSNSRSVRRAHRRQGVKRPTGVEDFSLRGLGGSTSGSGKVSLTWVTAERGVTVAEGGVTELRSGSR
jgi:hypothetical protein